MTLYFEKSKHKKVLSAVADVPEGRPSFPFPIEDVGISAKTVWVHLPEGFLSFEARISVDLAPQLKGIHMSRIEEAISDLHEMQYPDLVAYGIALGGEVIARQGAKKAHVSLEGWVPVRTVTRVSGKTSTDKARIGAEIIVRRDGEGRQTKEILMSAGVFHLTACPCTQTYLEGLTDYPSGGIPYPTHSQRSFTRLVLRTSDARPSYMDLFHCLRSALHVIQDLQKRPDEAETVVGAHSCPQFAEDAARETAHSFGVMFSGILPPESGVIIETTSFESIHIHDVICRIVTTLGEIEEHIAEMDH